ncbi:hypothetical protein [Flaviflexus massiliensis]|uniref:hypothetical protein n=1 Tax=Flaviflexus massiliensis TaxID=1522309 RepID=UPI0006D5A900|nr:hypothetical protein [Flaviflexus massiliensis]
MDKETLMTYWQIMGPARADEDRRDLHEMEPSPQVLELRAWANEALQAHHEWRAQHRPDLDIEAREV